MQEKTITIKYDEYDSTDELAADEKSLVESAWEAQGNSYSPYSNFKVGAAALTSDGKTFLGSNQETANHKASCAERVVLDSIGAMGEKAKVRKIAVVGPTADPLSPCGACRQDLQEIEGLTKQPIVIIMASKSKVWRIEGISNLLPLAFEG